MKAVLDMHCHTISSGHAYSTIAEMAHAAREKGLAAIVMADHGPAMPGGPHLYHFGNLRALPRVIDEVLVLRGVEANILNPGGELDMPDDYLKRLDIVLAGLHDVCFRGDGIEDNTNAIIKAMENPLVDVIVHPGNPAYPIDKERVVEAAYNTGTLLEINNSSFVTSRKGSYDNCLEIAVMAKERGIMVSLGSDAHFASAVGEFGKVIELIDTAGIPEQQIINTSLHKLRAFLRGKGKKVEF
ncbi:MAG: putative histidinol phosphatase and related hydrolases of the PHP family [Firmicutes bacterium]|nr:putative histidinol phosphatase and related hydrolases of the PHP family [Bacillota bacterium]MDI6704863.1 phosphatase [Bacillota bacterium]